jgi:hypothetical protein
MKKHTSFILIYFIIGFVQAQEWSRTSDNYTTGRLGIGTSTPASDFDIDIIRTNASTGIKMYNSDWAGRSIILFGQGSGEKYGYIAHYGSHIWQARGVHKHIRQVVLFFLAAR